MKTCKKCGHEKPLDEFAAQADCAGGRRPECKKCRTRNREVERKRHLKRTYGLSLEDYAVILVAQQGGCAICGDLPARGTVLHVDHDHSTGRIRGLLCQPCNTMLGGARDSVDILLRGRAYLEK